MKRQPKGLPMMKATNECCKGRASSREEEGGPKGSPFFVPTGHLAWGYNPPSEGM